MVVVESILEQMWRCFGETYPPADESFEMSEAETLARARQEAQHRSPNVISSSSSLDRSMNRSNKRKADIFRTKPSIEEDRRPKPMPYHGLLCFANPIQSEENALVEDQDGDETVASTVILDAKYDKVVQNRPPMPLYMEYSVPLTDGHDDAIAQIVSNGTHKSIHMLMDGENIQSKWYEQHVVSKSNSQEKEASSSTVSSPNKDRDETQTSYHQELFEMDMVTNKKKFAGHDEGLKLHTKSSVSTAAMTDVSGSNSMIIIRRQHSTSI